MQNTITKRDRVALIKRSGAGISEIHLRVCLSGHAKMESKQAAMIAQEWRKMRTILEPVYGPMPSIEIADLRGKNAK